MIARTKLLTFIISFIAIFFLLVALLGQNGYIRSRYMQSYLTTLESEIELKGAQIEALRSQDQTRREESYLNRDEKEVIMTNSDESTANVILQEDSNIKSFEGINTIILAFISLVLSTTITLLLFLLERRRGKGELPNNREEKREH